MQETLAHQVVKEHAACCVIEYIEQEMFILEGALYEKGRWRKGGREEGREGGREAGKEGGREGGREAGKEGGRQREIEGKG